MFRALVKSRMAALFSSFFRASGRKKRGIGFKILVGLLSVYIIACFCFLFGSTFYAVCQPLAASGLGWLYFAMAGLISTALCFIGSVFTAQQQLFSARDNDLLLSMPIPPRYILASRMLMLLILDYLFQALVIGPAAVVWCMFYTPSIADVVLFTVAFLVLPLAALALSCVFGWLLALVTARVRSKAAVSTVCSLVFLAAYFYLFSQMNTYITRLVQNGAAVAEAVRRVLYPAYAYGTALADGSLVSLAVFLLCCIVPFAVVWAVLARSFIGVATARHGAARIKYRERTLKVSGAGAALYRKELRHFSSNGMYIMNAALGSVFTLAAAIALVIYRDAPSAIAAVYPALADELGMAAVGALCMLAATNIISAPSVSLEGKNLWIAQSLPVSGGRVLMAKVYMHLTVSLPPTVLAGAVVIAVLRPGLLMALMMLLVPSVVNLFCALFGVVVNLYFPKLDWISEVVAVKQSMSTFAAMLGSMGAVLVPAALYILLVHKFVSGEIFLLLTAVLFAAVCVLLRRWLCTTGARRFAALG